MTLDLLRTEQAKERQRRFFRVLCDPRRGGETLTSISKAASIPYETVRSHAGNKGETAVMSWPCFIAYGEAFPDYMPILNPAADAGEAA